MSTSGKANTPGFERVGHDPEDDTDERVRAAATRRKNIELRNQREDAQLPQIYARGLRRLHAAERDFNHALMIIRRKGWP